MCSCAVKSLRRKGAKEDCEIVRKLSQLIMDTMVVMIGPIRQEILSGISQEDVFTSLKNKLKPFEDLKICTNDYVTAAQFNNICRRNGIQGSHTDFLICAVAHNYDLLIYTVDNDFANYAKFLQINLLN